MLKHWLLAARPKTLVASILPVCCGFLLAREQSPLVSPYVGLLCLFYCFAVQVGTNFANDYYDAKKGTDTVNRKGPKRMVQAGLIEPNTMKKATFYTFLLAFFVGVLLTINSSWIIFFIGIISIACGYLYTAGPYALAYNGLGDIFALIFFGPVAVGGTYFIQTNTIFSHVIIIGLGIGLISTALLAVNNIRDIDEDLKANKKTLIVRFGTLFGKWEFTLCLLISLLILWTYALTTFLSIYALTAYSIYCIHVIKKIWSQTGQELNNCLANTGVCLFFYGLIFCVNHAV